MKKLLFLAAFLLPGSAFADRLGGIKSSADVPLSTQTVKNNNTGTAQAAAFHTTSGTVHGPFTVRGAAGGFETGLEGKYIRQYNNTSFGAMGWVTEVHTEHEGGSGGPYYIIVSTRDAINIISPSLAGQSSFYLTPPSDNGSGGFGITLNGTQAWAVNVDTTTIDSDVNMTGDLLVGESAINTLTVTGPIIGQDLIATETGGIAFQGSTATFDAPPIDTETRIFQLYNGAVSFPVMALGASLNSSQTFTGANHFTSSTSFAAKVVISSMVVDSAGSFGTASQVFASNGPNSPPTWQTGGSGSADNLGNHTATESFKLNGNTITGAESLTFTNGTGTDWTTNGSSTSMRPENFTLTGGTYTFAAFELAANSTYSVTGALLFDPQGGTTGILLLADVPNDAVRLLIHLDGIAGTSAGYKSDEGLATDATANANPFGAYNAGEGKVHLDGIIVTGATGGAVNFCAVILTATSVRAGSQVTLVKMP